MAKAKRDIYQEVTDRILTQLEAGTAPWRKPWSISVGAPKSLVSKKAYRGINVLLLGLATLEKGYNSPYWATFKQITEKGGTVKGQKGTMITFWNMLKVDDKDNPGRKKNIPFLKHFYVWNLEQVADKETEQLWSKGGIAAEKLPVDAFPELKVFTPEERHAAAQAIVEGYQGSPSITHGGDRAFYKPQPDTITVPPKGAYHSLDEYYSTLFHEMGHSTGHESRLDRWEKGHSHSFGSHDYGREELVAEMTSAFLQAEAGIEAPQSNSAAYLASWIKTIKEDPKSVVWAAGRAQKAADHVLGREVVTEQEADKASEVSVDIRKVA